MTINRIIQRAQLAAAALSFVLAGTSAQAQQIEGCNSKDLSARFDEFSKTGKMPPEIGRWLMDPKAQYIAPFKAFDNVSFVGICWVSAWIITTPEGAILIDTLHTPHVDQLIRNIDSVGVKLSDIKYVFITHGHFDHAGGAAQLKPLLPNATFVMTQTGWDEAKASSAASQGTPRAWSMIPQEIVASDGEAFRLGGETIRVYATPGHTLGTASFAYDVKDDGKVLHAITVGGLGLNAIENAKQVEGYIASVDRIGAMVKQPIDPVTVHLTTHPFATSLIEAGNALAARKPGDPNPIVDPVAFTQQLDGLRSGAEARLAIEKKAGR